MSFNFKSILNLARNPDYLKFIEDKAKGILNGAKELSRSEVNSIFPDIAENNEAQLNLSRIMGLEGSSDTLSENELKTLLILMDAKKKNPDDVYELDGELNDTDKSGITDLQAGAMVYSYKTVSDKNFAEKDEMDGEINKPFGQDTEPVCFILAPLISLSKTDFGKELLRENLFFDKDFDADIVFNAYIVDKDSLPEDALRGDADAKAFIYSTITLLNEVGIDTSEGFSPDFVYYILTNGYLPAAATISGEEITTCGIEENIEDGATDKDIETPSTKYTQFKNVPLEEVPKGKTFKLENYTAETLKTLAKYNDKFAVICIGNGHGDSIERIETDCVVINSTYGSDTSVKYSFEEFLKLYGDEMIFMSIKD